MSIDTAVHELEQARQQLQERLDSITATRDEVASELERVDGALSALRLGHSGIDSTDDAVRVLDYTGKYRPLWQALCDRDDDPWPATFTEIEEILGFALPPSSRRHLPHWYGTGGSAVARAIHGAGWRATRVNLNNETVIFVQQ